MCGAAVGFSSIRVMMLSRDEEAHGVTTPTITPDPVPVHVVDDDDDDEDGYRQGCAAVACMLDSADRIGPPKAQGESTR
jgi:hypothetical protein